MNEAKKIIEVKKEPISIFVSRKCTVPRSMIVRSCISAVVVFKVENSPGGKFMRIEHAFMTHGPKSIEDPL